MTRIALIGEALYGPSWQTPLAEALGVALRTVQRWAAGTSEPAPGVWADLRRLAAIRIKEIRAAAHRC